MANIERRKPATTAPPAHLYGRPDDAWAEGGFHDGDREHSGQDGHDTTLYRRKTRPDSALQRGGASDAEGVDEGGHIREENRLQGAHRGRHSPPDTADALAGVILHDSLNIGSDNSVESDPAPDTVNDRQPSNQSLVGVFRGGKSDQRVNALRKALDDALDQWWSHSRLPERGLLRDGLLLLEAGHDLDEVHRSLLLRTALHLRKGMVTALRHQTDPDRVAVLLKESILHDDNPLPVSTLWALRHDHEESDEWCDLLRDELQRTVHIVSGKQRQRAEAALQQLDQDEPLAELAHPDEHVRNFTDPVGNKLRTGMPHGVRMRIPLRWTLGRVLLFLCFGAAATALYVWQLQRPQISDMVTIPAGDYRLGDNIQGVPERVVTMQALLIDRTEVTNRSYRRCVEQEGCTWPSLDEAALQFSRFFDTAFDNHPVGNVSWSQADAFCRWAGKRLPSADEWEVAASVAPATQRYFLYPWGDRFEERRANSQVSDFHATQQVASYHPGGDSSFGLSDMVGNVAEWTGTQAGQTTEALYTVKGGSYLDDSSALQTHNGQALPSSTVAPWLGFRCVADVAAKE